MTYNRLSHHLAALAFLTMFLLSAPSGAYYTFLDTGEVPAEETFNMGANLQMATHEIDGTNFATRFDSAITDSLMIRGILGFGAISYHMGVGLKWTPYPDYDDQPAVGFTTQVLYGELEDNGQLSVRLIPFVSKSYRTKPGTMNFYGALPIAVMYSREKEFYPLQVIGGIKIAPPKHHRLHYYVEMGMTINDAFNYATVGASYNFDPAKGFTEL